MNKIVNFMFGMILGAVVGASIAILLAPSSGEELRGKIQGEVERVRDEMQLAAETRRAELEQQLAQLQSKINMLSNEITILTNKYQEGTKITIRRTFKRASR